MQDFLAAPSTSPTKRPIPGMAGNIGMLSSDIADSRKALKVLKKERKDFQEKQAGRPPKKNASDDDDDDDDSKLFKLSYDQ